MFIARTVMGLFEPKNAVKPDADAFTDSMRKHDPRSPASPRKRLRGGVQSPLSPKRLLNKLRKPQKPGRLEPRTSSSLTGASAKVHSPA